MMQAREAGCVSSQPATLILGLGNPLRGDDGVGPFVVKELLGRQLPNNVEVLDGGSGGLTLLQVMEGWDRVIVVDAAKVGRQPGQFIRFRPDQAHLAQRSDGFSIHQSGLGEALTLAQALDQTIPEIVIFGVQPAKTDWGQGLSPPVQAALPALLDAVWHEIMGESSKEDDIKE